MSLSRVANESSDNSFEIAMPANGEPPFGSSKMPSTRRSSVAPVGVFRLGRADVERVVLGVTIGDEGAVVAERSAGTLLSPLDHVMATTFVRYRRPR